MNTFLDPQAADEAKQKAMVQVYASAPENWKLAARQAIYLLAHLKPTFTSDDVWRILYKPPNGKALGPVMAAFARAGVIEKTGTTDQTQQVSRHKTDVNVWKSLVYGMPPAPAWQSVLEAWKKVI